MVISPFEQAKYTNSSKEKTGVHKLVANRCDESYGSKYMP